MTTITYTCFDGIEYEQVGQTTIERYKTSRVTYKIPHRIELTHRYLKRFYPQCRKLMEWNPLHTPSIGWWLEFEGDQITLRSQTAHYMPHDHVTISYNISTPKLYRLALQGIAQTMKWCEDNGTKATKKPRGK